MKTNAIMTESNLYDSYATRAEASAAAAERLSEALERRLDAGNGATLVLSGGSTPAETMRLLAGHDLPWERVHVTLSDERWVPPSDPDSNERMLGEEFLATGKAGAATVVSLYADDTTIEDRCETLSAEILAGPFPFAATLLGMGEDGHFASLFPDAANLDTGLDADGTDIAVPVVTDASPHPRISLTLAALSRSDEIVLLIFGEKKLTVLDEAVADPERYPVGRLLRQKRAPVRVIWAP